MTSFRPTPLDPAPGDWYPLAFAMRHTLYFWSLRQLDFCL